MMSEVKARDEARTRVDRVLRVLLPIAVLALSVVVSVTRREAPSTAQSEMRVEKTSRGPGST